MNELNAICPYFTMFPLRFPDEIIKRNKGGANNYVLDPFCGRGTTNYAARINGMSSIGIDSSPVATSITESKLVNTTVDEILCELDYIMDNSDEVQIPEGEFWRFAYDVNTLKNLSKIRIALMEECGSDARIALRGIMLGALHGGLNKGVPSYFSNQCPRTYAPKPAYSVRYWKNNNMLSVPEVNIREVVKKRAIRYYSGEKTQGMGKVILGDCSTFSTFGDVKREINGERKLDLIITSPPYYGMKTYVSDQWLRNWFVGGFDFVDYSKNKQMEYKNTSEFTAVLNKVWNNCYDVSSKNTKLFIRFGAINSEISKPIDIIRESLMNTNWHICSIESAREPAGGSRQAESFRKNLKSYRIEIDVACQYKI